MNFSPYPDYKNSGVDWLGELPSSWKVVPLKSGFELKKRAPPENCGVVTAFRDGEVTLRSNRRIDGFTEAIQEVGYQGVEPNDLVIHAMDAFAGAIGVSDSKGKSTPVYSVCESKEGYLAKYYGLALRHIALSGYIESLAKGIRERSTDFRWSDAKNVPVPLPTFDEQKKIIKFVEHETSKIDFLILEQEKLIEILKEKQQAEISYGVTVGLNKDVEFKDSNIEWLNKIPNNWRVEPLLAIAKERNNSNKGMIENNLLSLSYGQIVEKDINTTDGLLPDSFETYQIVEPNDIVLRLTDLQNDKKSLRSAIVKKRGIITSAYLAVKPEKINPLYLNYLLRAYDLMKVFYSMGSGLRQSMNYADLKRMEILVPANEEQELIVQHLDNLIGQYKVLINESQSAVELLKERRTALISAAVTGQIDVRGYQYEEAQ